MVPLFQIIIIRRKFCVFSFNFWERFSLPSEFRATFLKKNHESIIDRSSFFFPREHDRDRDPEYVRLWSWPEVSIYTQLNVPQRGKTGADFDAVESTEVYYDSTWAVPGNPLCNGPVIDLNSGDNGSRRGSAYFAEPILLESKDRRAFDPSFSFRSSVLVWNEKRWYTFLYNAIRLIN